MARLLLLAAVLLLPGAASAEEPLPGSKIRADMSPIRKVITLLEEMKETCEKEAAADLASYKKYKCWCTTNEKEKTAAIEIAKQRIEDFETFIESSTAKAGELKTDIAGLEADIAEDKEAVASAAALREKEHEAFLAAEADMKETRYLLEEAVKVLSKVQLLQKQKGGSVSEGHAAEVAAAQVLAQVREQVQKRHPNFLGAMKRDLFDLLGSFNNIPQAAFLAKSNTAALEQNEAGSAFRSTTLLPWMKTEEQIGMEANPNGLVGMAAGAKSYNSRSGKIVGILSEMHDEFSRDLGSAQKAEFAAEVSYQQLRAAKLAEIAEATKLKKQKEAELADTLAAIAKAKEDKEATEEAMAADQKFLANLIESCKIEDEEYQKRVQVRTEEIRALAEATKILTEDDARDLYQKTMTFVQVDSVSSRAASAALLASQDRAKERIMRRLANVAKRHGNWALAAIAVQVRLDAFTKVKVVLDNMLLELQKQQKEEYAKWETCKADIDTTEDHIWDAKNVQEDLNEKHLMLSNQIATLEDDIAMLKKEVADMEISLKEAGEQRKAENDLFQTSVSDQRATINILQKALVRLEQFYMPSFAQVQAHGRQEPGAPAPPPPPKPSSTEYRKSDMSGGVLQLLHKVIEDSEATEGVLQVSEQHAQSLYATFVADTTASIEADRALTQEKEGQKAVAEAAKSETEEAQLANDQKLFTLTELLKAHHLECDYLLQYFNVRQTARAEEMSAITDAKAILSGAR